MGEQIVEDPIFRHRLRFERATDERGADVVEVEIWVEPDGGVPPHVHPAMEERFTVLDGRAELLAGRRWRSVGPGEVVVVPPGTRHAYRNRGAGVAHLRCVASPADPALEGFLTEAAALGRAGKLTRHGLPTGFGALLESAAMAHRYRQMVTLGFPPLPPPPLQRLLLPPLARLAERRRRPTGETP
jgi:quercetin dioxygenase-like cupin family protein